MRDSGTLSGYFPSKGIENVSRDDERIIRLSLAEMVQGLPTGEGPVLVMIGEALRDRKDI